MPAPTLASKTTRSDLSERRSHRRFQVLRPGKAFRPECGQYAPIVSRDLSFGGALLEIETERTFTPGEALDVGIPLSKKTIVPASALIRGVVVRSHALGEQRQLVAVRYMHREPLRAAA